MSKTIFSEKLVELRKQNKYTQKFVAEKLGLTKRQYGYLEYGNFTCDYYHIIELCKLYNVSADYLFGIEYNLKFPTTLVDSDFNEIKEGDTIVFNKDNVKVIKK